MAWRVTTKLVAGLQAERIQGHLAEGLIVSNLVYESDSIVIRLREAGLNWRVNGSLLDELLVSKLELSGLSVTMLETEADAELSQPIELPKGLPLPIGLVFADITITDFQLFNGRQSSPLEISNASLHGKVSADEITVELVELNSPLFTLAGTVKSLPSNDYQTESEFSWSLSMPNALPARGSVTISGKLKELNYRLVAEVQADRYGDFILESVGSAGLTELVVHSLKIHHAQSPATVAVDGRGTFSWSEEFIADFEFEGKHVDPGEVFPQWYGDISFSVKGKQRGRVTNLDRLEASGLLRGRAFNLDAVLSRDGASVVVPRFTLTAGESRLQINGNLGENLNLEWDLQSPDLAELLPDATGEIFSNGTLVGKMPWPSMQGELSITDLKIGPYRIGMAQLSASVDPLSQDTSSLMLHARELVVADLSMEALQLEVSGNRAMHNASLRIDSGPVKLALGMDGGWQDGVWQGALNSGEVKPGPLANWQLSQPQKLHFGVDQQVVKLACWLSADARLCLKVERKNGRIASSAQLFELPFDYFKPLLNSPVEVRGNVNGHLKFTSLGSGRWSTQGTLGSSASAIVMNESNPQAATNLLQIEPGSFSFKGDQQRISARFSLPIQGGGGAQGGMTITNKGASIGRAALGGDITVHLPDISFLSVFSQELQSLAGELKLDMKLMGTPQSPNASGNLSLNGASVKLATPGLALTEIEMVATGRGNGVIGYRGLARSGLGSLQIEGKSATDGLSINNELRITGKGFQVWNTADAQVTASPNLAVVISEGLIDITGDIEIPAARITPQELPSGAIRVSPDQVIVLSGVDPKQNTEATLTRDVRVQVDLVLGQKVEMEGFGFKGRMEGQLAIVQEPDYPMVASGELKILDGEYRAYGQGLVIDNGQILFAGGAIDNPGLSIRALRRPAPDIVVGVYVNGELRQAEVSLFSEPNMSQSEQLSWLVLGRSIDNSSGAESDYVTQAALVLGLKGGNFLTKNIGQNIGLDTLSFEAGSGDAGSSNDVNQAALVLGKYLTPKLYISYGLGLLDSLSTVNLRYLMTERWNLVTESSAMASGGDISYSFEK